MTSPDLWGLFASAFISSSLLPGASEAVLVWLLLQDTHADWLLVAVASLGNTLGAMTSWAIGLMAKRRIGSHFAERHTSAIARLQRHGAAILLLSWLPLIGDALCVAAGWVGIGWIRAMVYIALGKVARYSVVAWLVISG